MRNVTMTRPDDQAKQEHDNYWQAVADVAETIVAELQDTDEDRDEMLTRLIHEAIDQHDYVIREDLQIQTLQHSQHPCAALFNGTLLGHHYRPGDNFPFAAFAADAFEMDVIQKVGKLLGGQ
jgi:predicted transcriptional regulator